MDTPFDYQLPKEAQRVSIENLRTSFKYTHAVLLNNCPAGRELSLALTNLEQAAMWANKSITHAEI